MIDWILNNTNIVVCFLVTAMILGYGLLLWVAYQDYREWKDIKNQLEKELKNAKDCELHSCSQSQFKSSKNGKNS